MREQPIQSLPKSFIQKSHHKIYDPKNVLMANFKPPEGLRTYPSLLNMNNRPSPWDHRHQEREVLVK